MNTPHYPSFNEPPQLSHPVLAYAGKRPFAEFVFAFVPVAIVVALVVFALVR